MYAGKIVETGTAEDVLLDPKHPYTQGLITSIPSNVPRGQRLNVIRGNCAESVPNAGRCRFEPRCPLVFEPCRDFDPPLRTTDLDRRAACWLHYPPSERPTVSDVAVPSAPVRTERVGKR